MHWTMTEEEFISEVMELLKGSIELDTMLAVAQQAEKADGFISLVQEGLPSFAGHVNRHLPEDQHYSVELVTTNPEVLFLRVNGATLYSLSPLQEMYEQVGSLSFKHP